MKQKEKEQKIQKDTYEKPELKKEGALKDITARDGSPGPG